MKRFITLLVLITVPFLTLPAQNESGGTTEEKIEEIKGQLEGLNESFLETKTTVDALKKIKISGYIQTQFQAADTIGNSRFPVGNFSGGTFPTNVKHRFAVRRGRIKFTYDNTLTQYVLQLDATQNGVGIKDAYITVTEPWLKWVSMTGGIFDRPFGFEISYSSSMRESPERSRMFQTLFPGERELGAKLEINPKTENFAKHFNFKIGAFNGTGSTANENDRNKDIIGRFGYTFPFQEQNLAIDGGFSWYYGNVTSNSRAVYSIDKSTKTFMTDSLVSDSLNSFKRQYLGLDMQIYYDIPVEWLGGFSLRGEFISGKQPGTAKSGSFYNPGTIQTVSGTSVRSSTEVTPLYQREFRGFYITYIQNFGLKNQLVVKYDEMDPNTKVKGKDIGASTTSISGRQLTATDLKYSTIGLGWIYHWDGNVKFTAYYELISNEKANANTNMASLIPYKKDVKDNVFTFRAQYKF